jgi:polygalacturonase
MVVLQLLAIFVICVQSAPIFNVMDFGAIGDGITDDTNSVRSALIAAVQAGPSTVLFPSGKIFLTGAFNLSSNLLVDIQGTILAYPGSDTGHYVLQANFEFFGPTDQPIWQAFIHSNGANNITIQGGGLIDGNGEVWWKCDCASSNPTATPCLGLGRPHLFTPFNGTGLIIRDIIFQNSPMWNLSPTWFNNVYISNVTILSPIAQGSKNSIGCNTDGIDPVGCENMLVENSYISVGDDAIAVKSGFNWWGRTFGRPSRNITFRQMNIGTGHGISIGSEMSAGVYDILFENIFCNGTSTGPRIKSERGRGGLVANITYRNITLHNVESGWQVTEYYIDPPPPTNASATPSFNNITLENIIATGSMHVGSYFDGIPESIITNVTVRNVDLRAAQTTGICNYTNGVCDGYVLPDCPKCFNKSISTFVPTLIAHQPAFYPRLLEGSPSLGVIESPNATFRRLVLVKRTSDVNDEWSVTNSIIASASADNSTDLANGELLRLMNGIILCAYRHHDGEGVNRVYRIQVVSSYDNGNTWSLPITIISSLVGVWEPFLTQDDDVKGLIHVYYSAEITNGGEQDIVRQTSSDGGQTWSEIDARIHTSLSRNGMPGVVRLSDSSLLSVFEGFWGSFGWNHFTINYARSFDDGESWSQRILIHAPLNATTNAGSPQVALCSDNRVAIIYMSSEGESTSQQWPNGAHLSFSTATLSPTNNSEPLIFSTPTIVETDGYAYWPSFFKDDARNDALRVVYQNVAGDAELSDTIIC